MRFKQFLNEGTKVYPLLLVRIAPENSEQYHRYNGRSDISEIKAEKDIRELCEDKLPQITIFSLVTRTGNISCYFRLASGHYSLKDLDDINDQFQDIVGEYVGCVYVNQNATIIHPTIVIERELPDDIKIEADEVTINMREKGSSLKDIHKKLSCKMIRMFAWENISSNVLGLLQVKGLVKLEYNKERESFGLKWLEIIKRHLQGDKDVMECREELIAAGFKDYAKL